MRLAAYEDAIYHRDGNELSVGRAFPTFMFGLAHEVESLVVLGRESPGRSRSHYVLPKGAEFVALPHYDSLTDGRGVARALGGTFARFWTTLGRVDVVWVNGPSPMGLVLAGLGLVRRRRVVLGVRQNTLEYAERRHPGNRSALATFRAMDIAWRALARVVPVTAVGPEVARSYWRSRVHELSVSMVSERDIAPDNLVREYAGEIRVLSVGRLESEKNPLLLADILDRLVRAGGRWKLVVVGDGDLEVDLRARLEELGVARHAEFLGYVPLDRGLFDLYRSAHVFLHVSWTEGLPQVLLEAFAARLPTVATDVGGVGGVATGAALLMPPDDPDAAAGHIRRLVTDETLRDRLTAVGVARVRARTLETELHRLAAFIKGAD